MEVTFNRPKYRIRMFAFLFDFLCMTILGVLLVFAMQAIMNNVPYYKAANQTVNRIQLESGLYVEREDKTTKLMCDYYKPSTDEEYIKYNKELDDALTAFYKNEKFFDQSDATSGIHLYNIEKIPEGMNESALFIYQDETKTAIVEKSNASKSDLYDFYTKVMAEKAIKYVINDADYISVTRTISLSFIFIILLVPIMFSIIVFELIIPLIFRRGSKTLGKLIFKLSVVDNRGLACHFGRFLARFALLTFVEIIIGIVTLAVPLIVSFSMMVFTKTNQAFHDYVCNTYVVEAPSTSICLNEAEYIAKQKRDKEFVLNKDDVAYE